MNRIEKYFENPKFIWVIVCLGLFLRLPLLNDSFWLDEAAQALESARPFNKQFDLVNDFQPPFFHLLVHLLTYIADEEWWLRLASLIPGLLSIYLTYRLVKKITKNQHAALLSALLLSTSSLHIYYSQELRPYSLAVFLVMLSMWYFTEIKISSRLHFKYIFVSSLGLYTSYLFFLIFPVQLLGSMRKGISFFQRMLVHQIIAGIFFLPWLPRFIDQLKTGQTLRLDMPGWDKVVSMEPIKAVLLIPFKFLLGRTDLQVNIWYLLIGISLLTIILYLFQRAKKYANLNMFFIWLFLPILLSLLISFTIPILDPKRVLYCLPPFYILIAIGIYKSQYKYPLLILFLIINLSTTFSYYFKSEYHREQWRPAIVQLKDQVGSDDAVVFAFNGSFAPFDWYIRPKISRFGSRSESDLFEAEVFSTNTFDLVQKSQLDKPFSMLSLKNKIYVFEYLMDLTDKNRLVFEWLKDNQYDLVKQQNYSGIGNILVFEKQYIYAHKASKI